MLDRALGRLARSPVLLVATDFDGTLAPIVADPALAEATPRARRALATLARQAHTRVAVISGRGLDDLAERLGGVLEEGILLVGSHGSEFEPDLAGRLDPAQRRLRDAVAAAMDAVAAGLPGVAVEHKDVSSCLHYRNAERAVAAEALARLRRARRGLPGPEAGAAASAGPVQRRGKKVVEWLVLETNKGDAIQRLRSELGATALLYLGDDRTDEDAFRVLGPEDLAVKVGPGPSQAGHRVESVAQAADLLARLADLRGRALRESVTAPIADMGFVSDRHTGALITPGGEVTWLCPGRFDRPSIFASLLGGATAGRFVVRPAGQPSRGHQRYRGDSLVLETRWPSLSVIDYLDPAALEDREATVLVRRIVPHAPGARCAILFAPRHDYGRAETRIRCEDGRLQVRAGLEQATLEAPGVSFTIERVGPAEVARAELVLDEPLDLVLCCGRREGTVRGAEAVAEDWESFARQLVLPPRWTEEVLRSALILRGLEYAPSGAMVAALTSSLPEALGGDRNWDYRFTWLRDGAYACDALLRLGRPEPAEAFLAWIGRRVDRDDPGSLRPLYAVDGEPPIAEAELGHLLGYAASRPVRIGNGAASQLQVDVFGAVVDLVHTHVTFGGAIDDRQWRLVIAMVEAVEARWQEPDSGLWELRHALRQHLHAKVMCWVAVDRALSLADRLGRPAPAHWAALAETIRDEVLARGWSAEAGAFTTAYGSTELDAAALAPILHGLLPADDPRAAATVEAVWSGLRENHTVYRYRFDDGFRGSEGGFHICTAWLVEALWLVGRRDEAEALFAHLLGTAGSTGILSEQVDPASGAALGNVPQAYSHTGVIWNALTLSGSDRARRPCRWPRPSPPAAAR